MGLAEASAEMAGGCAASYERVRARAGSTCAGVQCAQGERSGATRANAGLRGAGWPGLKL